MLLLIVYVLVALVVSFLCSIAEAVILSVRMAYVGLLEQQGQRSGTLLRELKGEIDKPLAAILTLNTIAHTVGAAGAGAQAAAVFGSAYVAVASAILTLLILIFSEIIPKTLGARYWRRLAPTTAYLLRALIWLLYPFVAMAEWFTRGLSGGNARQGLSRPEFAALAAEGTREGQLREQESRIFQNMLRLREIPVAAAMTPRPVVFSLPEGLTVAGFFGAHADTRFSRMPVYRDEPEQVVGFVLRSDLLLAQAEGRGADEVGTFRRDIEVVPDGASLEQAFDRFLEQRAHIMLVVDEYGGMEGIITLEDVLETLLGSEIVDELDAARDMQAYARRLWRRRAQAMGIRPEGD
jgi:CBS domain containing-hemolysin-like protein